MARRARFKVPAAMQEVEPEGRRVPHEGTRTGLSQSPGKAKLNGNANPSVFNGAERGTCSLQVPLKSVSY